MEPILKDLMANLNSNEWQSRQARYTGEMACQTADASVPSPQQLSGSW